MGGLVSRCCFKKHSDIASKVKGVIHAAQPVVGSPKFYGYFKLGGDEYHGLFIDGIDGVAFQSIIGYRPEEFATLASALPGAVQLAPSKLYCWDNNNTSYNWIQWNDEVQERLVDGNSTLLNNNGTTQIPNTNTFICNDIYRLYAEQTGILGMLPDDFNDDRRDDFNDFVEQAKDFHEYLGDYRHPVTYQISSDRGHDTAIRFEVTEPAFWLRTNSINTTEGDGTVPLRSHNYLLNPTGNRSSNPGRDFTYHCADSDDVDHQGIFNRLDVREVVQRWVREIIDLEIGQP
jgi:hypothetical protein